MRTLCAMIFMILVLGGCASGGGAPGTTQLVTEEFRVPSEPGIEIYVRNKRPADMTRFDGSRIVLYVHGATYPSSPAFDLKLNGVSWRSTSRSTATTISARYPRYGYSTRPPRWIGPQQNPRRESIAMRDVEAVASSPQRRGVDRSPSSAGRRDAHHAGTDTRPRTRQGREDVCTEPGWIRKTASW